MQQYDVIIVGGGISGLSVLHYLRTRKAEKTVLQINGISLDPSFRWEEAID